MITVAQAFALGFAHEAAGRRREARAIYEQILAAIPEHPGALLKIAAGESMEGRFDQARALLDRALRSAEAQALPAAEIWLALGHVDVARADRAAARKAFERAHALDHPAPDVQQMLAWLALEDGDAERAEALCRAGLVAFPGNAQLLHLLGKALRAAGAFPQARAALIDAAAAAEGDSAILMSLGAVCIDLGQDEEARGYLQRAIAGGQNTGSAWDNLGLALRNLGDHGAAARAFERAVTLDPGLTSALSNLVSALRDICRWDEAEAREGELLRRLPEPGGGWGPFAPALWTTEEQQLHIARAWSREWLPTVAAPAVIAERGTRLRVGYLSCDLHSHATANLMAGLFERHDHARFATHAYSYGPDDGSVMRHRLTAAFDQWTEVGGISDADCAKKIRADGIDVLVDLKGHTSGSRLGILAHRPAPIQLHYLGYPGTLGYDGVDGIVADAHIVPKGSEHWYHERVWRLPRCYQVNDDRRPLPLPTARAALGLPDDALVLACFNQTYKLTRAFFAVWLDALRTNGNALLWLYVRLPLAQENLRAEAARAGIDPGRIRFAPRVGPVAHIARLRAADLALDTLPYGAHTTGSDALWAGIPLLSCRGTTFAGRVGASLLDAVGLAELAADSLDAYRRLLLALASDRGRLADYRAYLERERQRLPLFDTAGFARDFETLLVAAYEAACSASRASR
jgi:protein O-GlcNAc transferase